MDGVLERRRGASEVVMVDGLRPRLKRRSCEGYGGIRNGEVSIRVQRRGVEGCCLL